MSKKSHNARVRIITPYVDIAKSDTPTNNDREDAYSAGEWISPPTLLQGFERIVDESTILPQCIRAYKNNIVGFGIGVRYKEDVEESDEMSTEYKKAVEVVDMLSLEQDTKKVFEDVIEARETYGIAYVEVIRNNAGEVVQIEFITDTPSIQKTHPLEPYVDCTYCTNGVDVVRKKKFRKYKQTIGGKTVYFKEFGDVRIMDKRDGKYLDKGESLELQNQANEIIEFAIGTAPYGKVRWIGQILSVDGSRKAEKLNNNYFVNGRHTPLAIIVNGGTLTNESFDKLRTYMNDIKGESGQHAFLLLEAEGADGRVDFDAKEKPDIEIKDIANILQTDELFQNYLDNNRRKAQSAFQLPDLYVGYTTDFNRATAQTAMEVTEEQVFQPERKSLAWIINNKLLSCYRFKHVEYYFKEPNISNPDDIYKLLTVCNNAGGLTPNKAKEIVFNAYGETSEDYEGDWGNIPLSVSARSQTPSIPDLDALTAGLNKQIAKAASHNDNEIVAVMKEVRKLLVEMAGE